MEDPRFEESSEWITAQRYLILIRLEEVADGKEI